MTDKKTNKKHFFRGIIIAFIAAIAIVALNTGLRDAVVGAFDKASNAVTDATTGIRTATGDT